MLTKATNKIPSEIWNNKPVKLNNLKFFGNYCFVKIPDEKRRKLDDKAELMILLGYTSNSYRCYDFKKDKIIFSRDVVFERVGDTAGTITVPSTIEIQTDNEEENQVNNEDESHISNVELRRSDRRNKGVPPIRYGYDNVQCKYMDWMNNYSSNSLKEKRDTENKIESIYSLAEIPSSYNEAILHPQRDQ